MALTRGYSPAQFRDKVLGSIGPFTATGTVPSTAAGAVGTIAITIPATLGLQAGDILFVTGPLTTGVALEAQVRSSTALDIIASNGTGSAYNPGSQTFTIVGFRFNQA